MPSKRTGVMLAKKLTDKLLARMPERVFVQPKINGMRARAKWHEGKVYLYSSQGNVIVSVPHINEQLESVMPELSSFQPDGELYNNGLTFQEISGVCRKTTSIDARSGWINYHIFDLIKPDVDQSTRLLLLSTHRAFTLQSHLKLVETQLIDKEDWERHYERALNAGYEGIIIRNPLALYQPKRTADLLKRKHVHSKEFKIVGAFEATSIEGEPKGMLGGLYLRTAAFGEEFKCGAGCLSHAERLELWKSYTHDEPQMLLWHTALIDYPELTDRGVPHQPILRKIIE